MTDWTRKTQVQTLLEKLKKQCDTNGRYFELVLALIASVKNPKSVGGGWLVVDFDDGHKANVHAFEFSHGDTSLPMKNGKLQVSDWSYAASVAVKYEELVHHLNTRGNLEAARRQHSDSVSFVPKRKCQYFGAYN